MNIFGRNIQLFPGKIRLVKDDQEVINKAWYQDLEKNLNGGVEAKYGSRPMMDPAENAPGSETAIRVRPIQYQLLYELADASDIFSTINYALKAEIFRNGLDVQEKFSAICGDCGEEHEHDADICENEKCSSQNLLKPDLDQKKLLEKFHKQANPEQSLMDVSKQINDDEEKVDDGYMVLIKEYEFIGPAVHKASVVEIIRGNPKVFEIIADQTGRRGRDASGQPIYFCLEHRNNTFQHTLTCPACDKLLVMACYRARQPDGSFIYYSKDEVFHKSKYNPSLTYGYSNLIKAWFKTNTLGYQDQYIMKYYSKQRAPRGMLFIKGSNQSAVQKAWMWMLDQFKKNPHMVQPLVIEDPTGTQKGNFVEFVDFMRSLDEMQYTETREEMRRSIGALYRVMPIFHADLKDAGGLNNEGLQLTVTTRGMEEGQKLWNESFYPWLIKQLEVTDYVYELAPNEEQDELADEQLFQAKANTATIMQGLGFEVTLNKEQDFEYSPLETPVEAKVSDISGLQNPFLPPGGAAKPFGGAPPSPTSGAPKMPEAPKAPEAPTFKAQGKMVDIKKQLTKEGYDLKKPFAEFESFADCERKNQDKDNPSAYCASIMREVEGKEAQRGEPDVPFADYKDFADCERKNPQAANPGAYCAEIRRVAQGKKSLTEKDWLLMKSCDQVFFFDKVWGDINKARTVGGFESPEPGDIPEKAKQILANAYAACRKKGEAKERCSKIAWGAVRNAGFKSKKESVGKSSESYKLVLSKEGEEGDLVSESELVMTLDEPKETKKGIQFENMATGDFAEGVLDAAGIPFTREGAFFELHRPERQGEQATQALTDAGLKFETEAYKAETDDAVTTTTPSVYNPRHKKPKRGELIKQYAEMVAKGIVDEEIEKGEGVDVKKVDVTVEFVKFIEENLFQEAFKGMTLRSSNNLKKFLLESLLEEKGMVEIRDSIMEKYKLTAKQANTITRTEVRALQNKTREWTFRQMDPEGELKYKWIGPMDRRTTKICENITEKSAGGVTMANLNKIISKEVSAAKRRGDLDAGFEMRDFNPHYSCRHTFTRAF